MTAHERQAYFRVAVTGMGVIAPTGDSVAEFTDSLLAGRPGVRTITVFDPVSLATRIAGESRLPAGAAFRDRKIAFALEAARQAWADTTSNGSAPMSPNDASVSMGVGLELFAME